MTKLSGRKSFDKHRTVSPPRPAGKPSPRYKWQACGSEGSTATRLIPKCRSDVNAAVSPVALAKPVRFERSHWRDGIFQTDQLFACGKRALMAWRHPPHSAHQLSMAALWSPCALLGQRIRLSYRAERSVFWAFQNVRPGLQRCFACAHKSPAERRFLPALWRRLGQPVRRRSRPLRWPLCLQDWSACHSIRCLLIIAQRVDVSSISPACRSK